MPLPFQSLNNGSKLHGEGGRAAEDGKPGALGVTERARIQEPSQGRGGALVHVEFQPVLGVLELRGGSGETEETKLTPATPLFLFVQEKISDPGYLGFQVVSGPGRSTASLGTRQPPLRGNARRWCRTGEERAKGGRGEGVANLESCFRTRGYNAIDYCGLLAELVSPSVLGPGIRGPCPRKF